MYKDLQKSIVNVFFMDRIHHGNLMDGSPQKWRFGKRFSCEKLGDLLSSTSIFKGCSGDYFDITYSPWWISIATHRINWWLFVTNFWRIRKKLPPIAPLVFFLVEHGVWENLRFIVRRFPNFHMKPTEFSDRARTSGIILFSGARGLNNSMVMHLQAKFHASEVIPCHPSFPPLGEDWGTF